jgi:hypothetical protein
MKMIHCVMTLFFSVWFSYVLEILQSPSIYGYLTGRGLYSHIYRIREVFFLYKFLTSIGENAPTNTPLTMSVSHDIMIQYY